MGSFCNSLESIACVALVVRARGMRVGCAHDQPPLLGGVVRGGGAARATRAGKEGILLGFSHFRFFIFRPEVVARGGVGRLRRLGEGFGSAAAKGEVI